MNKYIVIRVNTDLPLNEKLYLKIEQALIFDANILEVEVVKGSENYRDLITGKGESL